MKVPLLRFDASVSPLEREIKSALDEVFETQQFILGPKVEALEAAIARVLRHAIRDRSGFRSDALLLALMAARHRGRGMKSFLPPHTFFATAGVVSRLGAVPVFADIDPVTYNIDPARIDRDHTEDESHGCRSISTDNAPTWTRSSRSRVREVSA